MSVRTDLPDVDPEAGFVLLTLLLAIFVGLILAFLASFALVSAGSTGGTAPIQAPLITYDS